MAAPLPVRRLSIVRHIACITEVMAVMMMLILLVIMMKLMTTSLINGQHLRCCALAQVSGTRMTASAHRASSACSGRTGVMMILMMMTLLMNNAAAPSHRLALLAAREVANTLCRAHAGPLP